MTDNTEQGHVSGEPNPFTPDYAYTDERVAVEVLNARIDTARRQQEHHHALIQIFSKRIEELSAKIEEARELEIGYQQKIEVMERVKKQRGW